jgi:uncharacterized protein (TIGR00297 family)
MRFLPPSSLQLLIGGTLAALAALLSWRLRWLKGSGAWAAFGLGSIVFGLGGIAWALVLLTFFISSSLLSVLFKKQKSSSDSFYEKGSRRDAGQVLANGFIAGLFVVLHVFLPDSWIPWTGFAAALAAANADTWATELGTLNKRLPILITSGKSVPRGTSGAVSLTGTLAALLGAAAVSAVAWFFSPPDLPPFSPACLPLVAIAGLFGSLVDSFLGAKIQAIYYCPTCHKETEQPLRHSCGTTTRFLKGCVWVDNDWVNLLCTASSALAAILTLSLLY